jgi:hypothetical protein
VRGETYGVVDSDLDTPAARLWCGISVDRSWVGSVHRQNARTMEYGFIQAIEQAACKRPGKMDKHERLMNEMRSTSNTRETEATVSLYFSPKTHTQGEPTKEEKAKKRTEFMCKKLCPPPACSSSCTAHRARWRRPRGPGPFPRWQPRVRWRRRVKQSTKRHRWINTVTFVCFFNKEYYISSST